METLLHAALSNAATAAFLALAVACLGRLLARRPAVLHCLWLLVLLKLVSPPLYQVPIPWPTSLSATEPRDAEIATLYLADIGTSDNPVDLQTAHTTTLGEGFAPNFDSETLVVARASLYEQCSQSVTLAGEWLAAHWSSIAALVWIAGSLTTAVVCARRIHRFQRLLSDSRPASDDIQDWVADLAVSLGIQRPPLVCWIEGRLSPMLWALGRRSRLIIPADLWKGLKDQERATLIVHELAHLRRGDHHVRIFELLVTVLCWWNPVLWWARHALRDVEEQCCDAWVVWAFPEAARSYAETLLETLDFLNQSELSEPLLASGFGRVHHLRRRLTMIMNGTTPRLISAWGALGSICLAILLLPVNATWAQEPEQPKEVRVIVKADGGTLKSDDEVIELRSADGNIVTGKIVTMDLRGDEPRGDLQSGDGVKQGRFVVELKADDTSVNVIAGTPEEAIAKIKDHLKTLKEKPSLSDKDQSLLKALQQVLEELKEIKAPSSKFGAVFRVSPGDLKATARRNVMIRRVEKSTNTSKSPEQQAEIGKLQSEVKKLAEQLAAAQSKLSQLEGVDSKSPTVHFVVPDNGETRYTVARRIGSEKEEQDKRVAIVTKVEKGSDVKAGGPGALGLIVKKIDPKDIHGELRIVTKVQSGDSKSAHSDQHRIDELEKMLKKLLEEVDSLKKARAK